MPPVCGFRLATAQPTVRPCCLAGSTHWRNREGKSSRSPGTLCERIRKKRAAPGELTRRRASWGPREIATRCDIIAHLPAKVVYVEFRWQSVKDRSFGFNADTIDIRVLLYYYTIRSIIRYSPSPSEIADFSLSVHHFNRTVDGIAESSSISTWIATIADISADMNVSAKLRLRYIDTFSQ